MSFHHLKRVLIVSLGIAAGACGQIPKEYRGTFVDQATGFRVELKASEGKWIRPDGSQESFPAKAVGVAELDQGQPGIYMRSMGNDQLEVFWVRPNPESRREEYGFVALEAEVVYTRLDPISAVLARHCERGQVLIDRVSQSFNGGCPSDSKLMELIRVKSPK
ncbi:hypothetical protein EBZ37_09005 [bacterium]|nr:hypothetical protein [bacterium]